MARPVVKRASIEEGVVNVVAEKGLHGTTIQDIADAAEVSPGLLYRYWKNRDDLAADVYVRHYLRLRERLAAAGTSHTSAVNAVRGMIREFLRFADENPVLLKFLLLSQHDLQKHVPADQGVRDLLLPFFEQLAREARLQPVSPALAVQILLGMVLQPVVGCVYGHLDRPVVNHADEIANAVERALLRPREVSVFR